MALAYSKGMAVGTPAPPFSLPGVDGQTYTLGSFADSAALVVVFTCNHCPYAVAVEPRLVELQRDYRERGVALVAINPNVLAREDDGMEAMAERAEARGFNFPYLADASQAVSRAYDAACTPDFFVFDGERRLVYNGRMDDNWRDVQAVQQHELRLVLDLLLDGKSHDFEVMPSMGCSIKWR